MAIKKMDNVFEHKIITRRVLRELRILRLIKHKNMISIKTVILPKSREYFDDLYVVFELMDPLQHIFLGPIPCPCMTDIPMTPYTIRAAIFILHLPHHGLTAHFAEREFNPITQLGRWILRIE